MFLNGLSAMDFQAPVLYSYFGRADDFDDLEDAGVSVNGKIVLVRAGKISFAEKVRVNTPYMDLGV